jgi:hypothetical protein
MAAEKFTPLSCEANGRESVLGKGEKVILVN